MWDKIVQLFRIKKSYPVVMLLIFIFVVHVVKYAIPYSLFWRHLVVVLYLVYGYLAQDND